MERQSPLTWMVPLHGLCTGLNKKNIGGWAHVFIPHSVLHTCVCNDTSCSELLLPCLPCYYVTVYQNKPLLSWVVFVRYLFTTKENLWIKVMATYMGEALHAWTAYKLSQYFIGIPGHLTIFSSCLDFPMAKTYIKPNRQPLLTTEGKCSALWWGCQLSEFWDD